MILVIYIPQMPNCLALTKICTWNPGCYSSSLERLFNWSYSQVCFLFERKVLSNIQLYLPNIYLTEALLMKLLIFKANAFDNLAGTGNWARIFKRRNIIIISLNTAFLVNPGELALTAEWANIFIFWWSVANISIPLLALFECTVSALSQKLIFIQKQTKLLFTWKALHLASLS